MAGGERAGEAPARAVVVDLRSAVFGWLVKPMVACETERCSRELGLPVGKPADVEALGGDPRWASRLVEQLSQGHAILVAEGDAVAPDGRPAGRVRLDLLRLLSLLRRIADTVLANQVLQRLPEALGRTLIAAAGAMAAAPRTALAGAAASAAMSALDALETVAGGRLMIVTAGGGGPPACLITVTGLESGRHLELALRVVGVAASLGGKHSRIVCASSADGNSLLVVDPRLAGTLELSPQQESGTLLVRPEPALSIVPVASGLLNAIGKRTEEGWYAVPARALPLLLHLLVTGAGDLGDFIDSLCSITRALGRPG